MEVGVVVVQLVAAPAACEGVRLDDLHVALGHGGAHGHAGLHAAAGAQVRAGQVQVVEAAGVLHGLHQSRTPLGRHGAVLHLTATGNTTTTQ